ncbi:MAG TPA: methyltransferase domain-containing protein [Myxococcota bacterium]|nr:methyltransferase domain-containing protein [Myxococcota bacterium]
MSSRTPTSGPGSWGAVAQHLRETARLRAELPPERVALQREVLRLAGRVHGRRALDVGCGTGALARQLAAAGADVLGIDASPAAVHAADHDAKESGEKPLPEFAVADLLAPATLPRGPFELITCVLALADGGEPARALAAVVKLLHPRGRFVFAIEHPWRRDGAHGPFAGLPELLGALRTAGLRLVDAAEPKPPGAAPGERPHHLVLSAERVAKRPRNRGTSG